MVHRLAAAVLALAGLTMIAAAGYLLTMDGGMGSAGESNTGNQANASSDTATQDKGLLRHVPAETVLYSGFTDNSLAVADAASGWGEANTASLARNLPSPREAARGGGPGAGIAVGIYHTHLDEISDDNTMLRSLGRGDGDGWGLYTVGALPVMRLEVSDTQRFWQTIDDIESQADVSPSAQSDSGMRMRRYPFNAGDEDRELTLVVATGGGDAVVTVDGSGVSDDALAIALGKDEPASSLADSDKLERLAKRHGTDPGATGFLDHEGIVAGLTDKNDSRLGGMLSQLGEAWGNGDTKRLFNNAACRQDARAIAAAWPHTVFGLTEINEADKRFDMRLAVAVSDGSLLEPVRDLRGHIPDPVDGSALLNVGLGVEAGKLGGAIKKIADRFTGADFSCPQLQQAQQRIKRNEQRLGQLQMVTRMAGDLSGVSAAVLDLESGEGMTPLTGDAIVEVATPKPQAIWQTASSTFGIRAASEPTPGGDPVALKGVRAPGAPPLELALRNNAIVVVAGDAELDAAAGEADVEPNGLLRLAYDNARLMKAVDESGAAGMAGPEAGETLSAAQETDLRYRISLDTTSDAVRLDSRVSVASDD